MAIRNRSTAQRYLVVLLLTAAVVIAYLPISQNSFVNYDDPGYVTQNTHLRQGLTPESVLWSFTATTKSNWHPLTWISHELDITLFGLNPVYHHWMSVILHILSSILLYLLIERLTSERWKSAFVAAVFALHPLHVESVAWVAERKDVLSGLFWILTLHAYVWFRQSPAAGRYILAVFLFALGLMAKPMVISLPVVLLLLDYWPLGPQPGLPVKNSFADRVSRIFSWRNLRPKVPFFLLAAVSGVITYIVQSEAGSTTLSSVLPFGVRIQNAIVAYATYVAKTFVPSPISVFYPHPLGALPTGVVMLSAGVLAAITYAAWHTREKYPYIITGWLWFIIVLVPVIGLIQAGLQAMADRYTYIPMIGLAIIIAWGSGDCAKRFRVPGKIAAGILACTIPLMMIATHHAVGYWNNSITLFEHAVSVTTGNDVAETNLGTALADSGRDAEAVVHLREACRLRPSEPLIRSNLARSLARIGRREEALRQYLWLRDHVAPDARLFTHIGDLLGEGRLTEEAIAEYRKALQLTPGDPAIVYKLGTMYLMKGDTAEARRQCMLMFGTNPGISSGHDLMGMIDAQEQKPDEAIGEFGEAIRLDPGNFEAYLHLGLLNDKLGKRGDALRAIESAVGAGPRNWQTRILLGNMLARAGRTADAAVQWNSALRINPAAVEAHINLGRLASMEGRADEASSHLLSALAADPSNVAALYTYGTFLAGTGRAAEAARQFEKILQIDPSYEPARRALAQLR